MHWRRRKPIQVIILAAVSLLLFLSGDLRLRSIRNGVPRSHAAPRPAAATDFSNIQPESSCVGENMTVTELIRLVGRGTAVKVGAGSLSFDSQPMGSTRALRKP